MDDKAIQAMADAIASKFRNNMTLERARKLSKAVRQKAADMGVNAVVAVSDSAGHPILVECMDNSYIASYDVAVNKAFTVVALKMSTADLKPLAQPNGSLYGIQFTNGGRIVIFGGGEFLTNGTGDIIGGLGVSGGTEAQDSELAAYGKQIFEKGRI